MQFNNHSNLEGEHAFLSPSKYSWLNYSEDKLAESYMNQLALKKGTELHLLASMLIHQGVRLPDIKQTLNMYVNDAIKYRMTPEQPLYFSPNCFGTADAISFRRKHLRIHDLKTGVTPASMKQLQIYAALFCLEYNQKPTDIDIELRIYQTADVLIENADGVLIGDIMNKIVVFDQRIEKLKMEV